MIYHYEWQNDFAAAKNYALNQAQGEWIIFLDADEYLSNEARQSFELYMKKLIQIRILMRLVFDWSILIKMKRINNYLQL